jgi:hypothetical protein
MRNVASGNLEMLRRLPDLLADRDYDLKSEPDGERILPVAVSQKMTMNADGTPL